MIIFRNCIKSIILIAFPVFVAINAYYFLIYLDPSLNFLGADLTINYLRQQQLVQQCPYGGVSYFGFKSLLNFYGNLPTDNIFSVLRGLLNSFKVANFAGFDTIPDFTNSIKDPNILLYLKEIYVILSYAFMPLIALGWLGYSIGLLAVDIVGVFDQFLMALGGAYNSVQCYTYPQSFMSVLYYFGI